MIWAYLNLSLKMFMPCTGNVSHDLREIQYAPFNLHIPHSQKNVSLPCDARHRTLSRFHGNFLWRRSHCDISLEPWPSTHGLWRPLTLCECVARTWRAIRAAGLPSTITGVTWRQCVWCDTEILHIIQSRYNTNTTVILTFIHIQ